MTVVSNTSPLRYLIAVDRADLIESIFGQVLIPRGVEVEITHPSAPAAVRHWMAQEPTWIEVRDLLQSPQPALIQRLDRGEAEAVQLAIDLNADFLLIDERNGRQMATDRGVVVVGVLGILLESYRRGSIQNPMEIFGQLRTAGFRVSARLRLEFENQIASLKTQSSGGTANP